MGALRVWWRAWRHLRHRGYIYIWANLCFVIVALPIITAPAGFAGLVKLSRALQQGERADLNTYWAGLRENLGRGTLLGIATVAILFVNISNLVAYEVSTILDVGLRVVWIGAIWLWLTLMFYFWPLYYALESPSTAGALRNALLMTARHPVFTLIHFAALAALALLSSILPFLSVLLTFAVAAIVSAYAVADCLAKAG